MAKKKELVNLLKKLTEKDNIELAFYKLKY